MASPQGKPEGADWLRAYSRVQMVSDAEILAVLTDANTKLKAELARISAMGVRNVSEALRMEQMLRMRQALLTQQADVLRRTGNVIAARRLDAAAAAIKLGNALDQYIMEGLGGSRAATIGAGLTRGLEHTLETSLARMGLSYTDLSSKVYGTDNLLTGRVDRMVNEALARGLTAREFAAEAARFIDPSTPGGVRYAAMRLARSEINNAYHAQAVADANEKPWVNAMRWHLSSSHPKADVCNEYAQEDKYNMGAGVFPKKEVPRKPHPHCYCYVTPEVEDEDDFLDNLLGGGYDDYIAKKRASLDAPAPAAPKIPTVKAVASKAKTEAAAKKAAELNDREKVKQAARDRIAKRSNLDPKIAGRVQQQLFRQVDRVPYSARYLGDLNGDGHPSAYAKKWDKEMNAGTGAYYEDGFSSINLSPDWVDDERMIRRGFEHYPNSDGTAWFSRSLEEPLPATVAHEFGHHMEAMASGTGSLYTWTVENATRWVDALKAEFPGLKGTPIFGKEVPTSRITDWLDSQKSAWQGKLSEYGNTNNHEFIAEIWSEYTTAGAGTRPFVSNLGALLEEMAEAYARSIS